MFYLIYFELYVNPFQFPYNGPHNVNLKKNNRLNKGHKYNIFYSRNSHRNTVLEFIVVYKQPTNVNIHSVFFFSQLNTTKHIKHMLLHYKNKYLLWNICVIQILLKDQINNVKVRTNQLRSNWHFNNNNVCVWSYVKLNWLSKYGFHIVKFTSAASRAVWYTVY